MSGLSTITVVIPSDKPTLQAALDAYSTRAVKQGVRINLHIETGHALMAGLSVANGDYSHFMVTSADAEVLLDAAFPTTTAVFKGLNARMPVWGILVNCNNQVVGSAEAVPAAIIVDDSSMLNLEAGTGAKNVRGAGLFVRHNSSVQSDIGCIFSGCAGRALLVSQTSDVVVPEADFTNSTDATSAVYVSRGCRLSAIGADFSGATGSGLLIRRSYALLIPSQDTINTRFDNCGNYAIEAVQGSTVIAHHRNIPVVINNCANGIFVEGTSSVDFRLGKINTVTGNAFTVDRASALNAQGASALNVGGNVLQIAGASKANIRSMTANGATGYAVLASGSSMVAASSANFSGNGGTNAVHSGSGAHVDVSSADLSLYAGAGVELNVAAGGTISAHEATYTASNQFANIVTAAGIIYDSAEDNYPLQGSNANGTFVKFPDRTMICTHAMKAEFNSASRLRASWTLPAAFAAADHSFSVAPSYVSPAGVREGIAFAKLATAVIVRDSHSTSLLTINVDDSISSPFVSGDFIWLSLMATGHWK